MCLFGCIECVLTLSYCWPLVIGSLKTLVTVKTALKLSKWDNIIIYLKYTAGSSIYNLDFTSTPRHFLWHVCAPVLSLFIDTLTFDMPMHVCQTPVICLCVDTSLKECCSVQRSACIQLTVAHFLPGLIYHLFCLVRCIFVSVCCSVFSATCCLSDKTPAVWQHSTVR